MDGATRFPAFRQVVLDCPDVRALSEFYRQLLGFDYPPGYDVSDPAFDDWLVVQNADGSTRLAFQQVLDLPAVTWPTGPLPQQMHLDLMVASTAELDHQHERALGLGAQLLLDQASDAEEPLRVYADPAGHPFCLFVRVPS